MMKYLIYIQDQIRNDNYALQISIIHVHKEQYLHICKMIIIINYIYIVMLFIFNYYNI